jgi:hypothetical protein
MRETPLLKKYCCHYRRETWELQGKNTQNYAGKTGVFCIKMSSGTAGGHFYTICPRDAYL